MATKVSVIVPVYNVEKFLRRCMDSLISQAFKDIEIIAINDGSTDKSLEILREYEEIDSRVKVIDKENSGVSKCRNIGIDVSKGEYIMFVDSDDWIDTDMIENMYYKALEEKADLIMCTYTREFINHSKERVIKLPSTKIYDDEEVKKELLRKLVGPINKELASPDQLDVLGTIWGKLYKTENIKSNKLVFIDLAVIGSAEDTLFNIYTFNCLKKVVFINRPMYHYWKGNSESITSKYNPNLKEQRKAFFKYIDNFIKENRLGSEFEKALENRICTSVLGLGLVECSVQNKVSTTKKIKNIKNILETNYIEKAYKKLEIKHFPIHWRLFYFFNKNKMATSSYFMLNSIEFLRTRF
ncbi:glycosyltransferase [Clostridium tarantellae]|uniref:Glycosyltransferase n=1 Tax=Clostridium tarantellae TaxID=39493 RepID=A0A6I1MHG6_9CLOT|nr:glycosyltransferase [Clostridium tarantellae]MPQ42294.1 glycosyltransferase [Clostridium tarantellae]